MTPKHMFRDIWTHGLHVWSYTVSSDIQDTSSMHGWYEGYGIPLHHSLTAYTTSTMYTMDTTCILLRVGTHEQYHHVIACIWWHEMSRYTHLMTGYGIRDTWGDHLHREYPLCTSRLPRGLRGVSPYPLRAIMAIREYPVVTRYHDIACIWWHENTWFDDMKYSLWVGTHI